MQTTKTTIGTRTKLATPVTDLGSVVGFDSNNFNTFHDGFVLDKTLQLKKTPVTNPIVHNLSPVSFPDAFKVFHNYLVTVEVGNNVFTDVVVDPSHPTSFSSRKLFKQSFTGTSAFDLKFGTQMFELPLNLFDFSRIIKPAVRADSEVVYSEVNAQNNVLRTTVLLSGNDLFRECEHEKTSTFFIHPQQTFTDIPTEILFITCGDSEIELLPGLKKSQNQSRAFNVSASWKVIPDRSVFYDRFGFSFLDHATSLTHTSDSNLGRQFESFPDCTVYSIMEFEVLSDFMFPCIINTELERFGVSFDSSDYSVSGIDSNLCSDSCSHNDTKTQRVYKCIGNGEAALDII